MTAHTLSKKKIIDQAIKLVRAQQPATFSRIAKSLSISSQSIYNYFKDGDELKGAVSIRFYDSLYEKLQAGLVGVSGKTAIVKYCQICTNYAIDDFLMTQYVINMPKWMFHGHPGVEASLDRIYEILKRLVDALIIDDKQALIVARMLRNLVTGEVIHIGTGRFKDPLVDSKDSFQDMLQITLLNYG